MIIFEELSNKVKGALGIGMGALGLAHFAGGDPHHDGYQYYNGRRVQWQQPAAPVAASAAAPAPQQPAPQQQQPVVMDMTPSMVNMQHKYAGNTTSDGTDTAAGMPTYTQAVEGQWI